MSDERAERIVSDSDPKSGALTRDLLVERYDAAALTVSRIHSEDLYETDWLDRNLPYYEGRRDALRDLLGIIDSQEASHV